MQPRYQVFVSSTFRDLREERQAALEAILELGHFPAGMEAFPAADDTPWELIRSIIADSDYYVLVVGGKYGSTGPDGISYTEMEFNLAVDLNKPILGFLHAAPEEIPSGRSELDPEARKRLDSFRTRVAERLVKTWRTKDELKAAILLALVHAIRTKPADGWIRNEGLENQELLKRLAALQARYDGLEAEAKELRELIGAKDQAGRFASLDALYSVMFKVSGDKEVRSILVPWSELFYALADEMLIPASEYFLREALRATIATAIISAPVGANLMKYRSDVKSLQRDIEVEDEKMVAVLRQLMAKGLIEPQLVLRQTGDEKRSYTASTRCWVLTAVGKSRYLEKRAILSDEE